LNEDTVRKWILKADNDLKVAKDELETDEPVTASILTMWDVKARENIKPGLFQIVLKNVSKRR